MERLAACDFTKLAVTDTIPIGNRADAIKDRLVVLGVAELLGEAIHRIHHNKSVSELFQDRKTAATQEQLKQDISICEEDTEKTMAVQTAQVTAKPRSELGSRANKRLRDAGMLPGVIYGHKEAVVPVTLPKRKWSIT